LKFQVLQQFENCGPYEHYVYLQKCHTNEVARDEGDEVLKMK